MAQTMWVSKAAKMATAALAGAIVTLAGMSPALGQNFPEKPIQLVIPFGPGGLTDLIARTIQPKLAEHLGATVVVNNRPGAGGVIATNHVAKADPDGHTLFLSWDTHTINSIVMKELPYDIFKDFEPVTLMVRLPLVMGAWGALPADTLPQLISMAKKEPGKYNFASIGVGSSNRLHSELLNQLADMKMTHIPYKGGGPAIQAIVTGEVAYGFFSYGALRSFLQSGQVKALAVTGTRRMQELPQVPTMQEAGFKGFEAYSWVGIYAPAGTPKDRITRLNSAFVQVLTDPAMVKRLTDMGVEVVASTPQQLRDFERNDYEKWRKFTQEVRLQFE
ncbi:MAG: tripartite tricarboxylate transporter substrate binding protein [Burkholderiaceae bacterium]